MMCDDVILKLFFTALHLACYYFPWWHSILISTFLGAWGPDNIVGQCCSFPHAVSNVVHSSISLNVGVGSHSIDVDIVHQINLCKNEREYMFLLFTQ